MDWTRPNKKQYVSGDYEIILDYENDYQLDCKGYVIGFSKSLIAMQNLAKYHKKTTKHQNTKRNKLI